MEEKVYISSCERFPQGALLTKQAYMGLMAVLKPTEVLPAALVPEDYSSPGAETYETFVLH